MSCACCACNGLSFTPKTRIQRRWLLGCAAHSPLPHCPTAMREQRRRRPQRATLHRTQLHVAYRLLPLSFTNCDAAACAV
eukprot:7380112-Prymnesium_polylepis.1